MALFWTASYEGGGGSPMSACGGVCTGGDGGVGGGSSFTMR